MEFSSQLLVSPPLLSLSHSLKFFSSYFKGIFLLRYKEESDNDGELELVLEKEEEKLEARMLRSAKVWYIFVITIIMV